MPRACRIVAERRETAEKEGEIDVIRGSLTAHDDA